MKSSGEKLNIDAITGLTGKIRTECTHAANRMEASLGSLYLRPEAAPGLACYLTVLFNVINNCFFFF